MVAQPEIEAFLKRHHIIGIDTCIFIYQIEEHSRYSCLTYPIFHWIESNRDSKKAITSTLTMLELLVQPYRLRDIDQVNKFYALLSTYPSLKWVDLTLGVADQAARLRAHYNLKTPDAIQLAAAVCSRATGFIGNDADFRSVTEIEILILEDILSYPKT